MSLKCKTMFLPTGSMVAILSGEKFVSNLPADAKCVGAVPVNGGIGLRIESSSFKTKDFGEPMQMFTAQLEARRVCA